MPLPSTRVVHSRWAEHHRPSATTSHVSRCQVWSAVDAGQDVGWSPDTGPGAATPGNRTLVYDGPCLIEPLSNNATQQADAAGQPTYEHPYQVTVDYLRRSTARISPGSRVQVTENVGDPQLVGMWLTVGDTRYSSYTWERVLTCDLDLSNQEA